MSVDAQRLIDEAVGLLKQTTVGYAGHTVRWQNTTTTKWWQGLDRLAQARALLDPPAAPVVPPLWDGRASAYVSLPANPETAASNQSTPAGLACIFVGDDIRIVDDPRWGKAFQVTLSARSKNPGWTGQTSNSAEVVEWPKRTIELGQEDWWAQSIRLPSSWLDPDRGWTIVSQFGYPTVTSPPGSLLVLGSRHWANSLGVPVLAFEHNGGEVTAAGNPAPHKGVIPLRRLAGGLLGRRVDFVVGFRWELDATGWATVATRAEGEDAFTVRVDVSGSTAQKLAAEPLPLRPVMDKQGGYQSEPPASWAAGWTQTFRLRGLTRHASRADAERSLS